MRQNQTLVLIIVLVLIAGAIFLLESQKAPRPSVASSTAPAVTAPNNASTGSLVDSQQAQLKAKMYPSARELVNPSGFLNVERISIGELVGKKVILVDFWTYSCINCQRTFPYLKAWYEKYKSQGLEIIGVHTPEFEFEKSRENVAAAIAKFGIPYPVVQDNDYATWRAYGNRYWPRKYLIDIDGFIVYDHIGEGAYEQTEQKIQELLAERMARLGQPSPTPSQLPVQPPIETIVPLTGNSPEVYFGAARNRLLANGEPGRVGEQNFIGPLQTNLNLLYLVGTWNFTDEFAQNKRVGDRVIFPYRASSVFMVASADQPVNLTILRDGKPLASTVAGRDVQWVANESVVTITEPRLYRLIEDPSGVAGHTLELIVQQPGLRAFTFAFG